MSLECGNASAIGARSVSYQKDGPQRARSPTVLAQPQGPFSSQPRKQSLFLMQPSPRLEGSPGTSAQGLAVQGKRGSLMEGPRDRDSVFAASPKRATSASVAGWLGQSNPQSDRDITVEEHGGMGSIFSQICNRGKAVSFASFAPLLGENSLQGRRGSAVEGARARGSIFRAIFSRGKSATIAPSLELNHPSGSGDSAVPLVWDHARDHSVPRDSPALPTTRDPTLAGPDVGPVDTTTLLTSVAQNVAIFADGRGRSGSVMKGNAPKRSIVGGPRGAVDVGLGDRRRFVAFEHGSKSQEGDESGNEGLQSGDGDPESAGADGEKEGPGGSGKKKVVRSPRLSVASRRNSSTVPLEAINEEARGARRLPGK